LSLIGLKFKLERTYLSVCSVTKTIYVGSAYGALACLAHFSETNPALRVTWIY